MHHKNRIFCQRFFGLLRLPRRATITIFFYHAYTLQKALIPFLVLPLIIQATELNDIFTDAFDEQ